MTLVTSARIRFGENVYKVIPLTEDMDLLVGLGWVIYHGSKMNVDGKWYNLYSGFDTNDMYAQEVSK